MIPAALPRPDFNIHRDIPVKWYDQVKGIGFANVFGLADDVFLHVEVLRAAGIASLETGEAVALRTVQGDRGWMAVEVSDWSRCST